MKTVQEFYNEVIGKRYDIDGAYGAQCWDGAMYYSKWLGKKVYHCTQSGYVKDIWNLRKTSGILNEYKEVQRPFQPGDIIVWGECAPCPLSHIAIFWQDNADGTFNALGQNQGGVDGAFNVRRFDYTGVLGGFRPISDESKPEKVVITKEAARSVYRLYSGSDHLYTQSHTEAQRLADLGWKYEGVGWIAPENGDPVYRLYASGKHLFTADQKEKDKLVDLGWKLESVAFYSSGSRPIYRMYNPNSGAHILTADRKEHDALTKAGWYCEGQDLKY